MIKCLICGTEFEKRVSFCNHISRKHNINAKDYYDKYIKKPEDGICKYDSCNNPTIFINVEVGYKDCCCLEHTNLFRYGVKSNLNLTETKAKAQKNSHTKEAIEKQAKTNLERYGVRAPLQSKEIQAKAKQTCLDKYGVDNLYKSEAVQDKAKQTRLDKYGDANYNNRDKAKQTCLDHFGVESPMQSSEVKAKLEKTSIARYGTKHPLSSEQVKSKIRQTNLRKYGAEAITSTEYFKEKSKATLQLNFGVDNCQKDPNVSKRSVNRRINRADIFEKEHNCTNIGTIKSIYGQGFLVIKDKLTLYTDGQYTFVDNNDIQKIVDYTNTHTRSRVEDEIFEFIKSIYHGKVIHDDRSLIKPLELDIYIPDKKVAIEYNSVYYHSQLGKEYHLMKTEKCLEHGVRLIHIFEWEWLNNRDICESIIKSALGIYDDIIYARKCSIKEVPSHEARQFLDINHIQGKINSSYRLGLYFNDDLVQLICLGKSRFKKDEIELLRMCTKLNTQVIGGFSRLIHHIPYTTIISYLDRSKFDGNGYKKVGFEVVSKSSPSWFYIKNDKVMNRISAQKHKLQKLLGDKFDSNKTESQNMIDNGWLQVYDCGTIKMQYKRK